MVDPITKEEGEAFLKEYYALLAKYSVGIRPIPKFEHTGDGKYVINVSELSIEKINNQPVISPLNEEIQGQATTDPAPEEGSESGSGESTTV